MSSASTSIFFHGLLHHVWTAWTPIAPREPWTDWQPAVSVSVIKMQLSNWCQTMDSLTQRLIEVIVHFLPDGNYISVRYRTAASHETTRVKVTEDNQLLAVVSHSLRECICRIHRNIGMLERSSGDRMFFLMATIYRFGLGKTGRFCTQSFGKIDNGVNHPFSSGRRPFGKVPKCGWGSALANLQL